MRGVLPRFVMNVVYVIVNMVVAFCGPQQTLFCAFINGGSNLIKIML